MSKATPLAVAFFPSANNFSLLLTHAESEQITADVPIDESRGGWSQTSGAAVVAVAWHCWHPAGGLFNDAARYRDQWQGVATVIAGALIGAVQGVQEAPPLSDANDRTRRLWAQLRGSEAMNSDRALRASSRDS